MSVAASLVTKRRNWWVRSRAWIAILILVPFGVAAVVSPPRCPKELGSTTASISSVGSCSWSGPGSVGGPRCTSADESSTRSSRRDPIRSAAIRSTSARFSWGWESPSFSQSLTFAIGIALATTFYLSVTVPAEEIMLREKFGQTFVDYCRKVPRYLAAAAPFPYAGPIAGEHSRPAGRGGAMPAGFGCRFSAKWSRIFASSNGGRGCCTCPNEQRL